VKRLSAYEYRIAPVADPALGATEEGAQGQPHARRVGGFNMLIRAGLARNTRAVP
jgi:hypothetical protein